MRKKSKRNKKRQCFIIWASFNIPLLYCLDKLFLCFKNSCSALNQVSNVFSIAGSHTSPVLISAKVPTFCLSLVIFPARTFKVAVAVPEHLCTFIAVYRFFLSTYFQERKKKKKQNCFHHI